MIKRSHLNQIESFHIRLFYFLTERKRENPTGEVGFRFYRSLILSTILITILSKMYYFKPNEVLLNLLILRVRYKIVTLSND